MALTIIDLEKQGRNSSEPIWVLNSSMESDVGVIGDVLLTIPNRTGTDKDPILVPSTWLPQNLTKYVPRAQLLRATEFRKALNSKLITLIDSKTAAKLLADEGAQEEQERLDAAKRHAKESNGARAITAQVTLAPGQGDDSEDDENHPNNVKHELVSVTAGSDTTEVHEVEGISSGFQMFADRLPLVSDADALNQIKGRKKFTTAELKYLKKVVKGVRCQALIKATLEKLKSKK